MTDKGGPITLSTSFEPATDMVVLSVEDRGSGMPPDVVLRAFDPFFTTKPPGKGTGLGLSQVFGVVHQLGGDISIESKVGEGTAIQIRLRRSEADPPSVLDAEHPSSPQAPSVCWSSDDDDDVARHNQRPGGNRLHHPGMRDGDGGARRAAGFQPAPRHR